MVGYGPHCLMTARSLLRMVSSLLPILRAPPSSIRGWPAAGLGRLPRDSTRWDRASGHGGRTVENSGPLVPCGGTVTDRLKAELKRDRLTAVDLLRRLALSGKIGVKSPAAGPEITPSTCRSDAVSSRLKAGRLGETACQVGAKSRVTTRKIRRKSARPAPEPRANPKGLSGIGRTVNRIRVDLSESRFFRRLHLHYGHAKRRRVWRGDPDEACAVDGGGRRVVSGPDAIRGGRHGHGKRGVGQSHPATHVARLTFVVTGRGAASQRTRNAGVEGYHPFRSHASDFVENSPKKGESHPPVGGLVWRSYS